MKKGLVVMALFVAMLLTDSWFILLPAFGVAFIVAGMYFREYRQIREHEAVLAEAKGEKP